MLTAVAMLPLTACNDPRISFDEFLAMQNPEVVESAEASHMPAGAMHPMDQMLTPYKIGAGDVLEVSLTGIDGPTLTNVFRVRVAPSGNIDLPLAGEIPVMDMEDFQAEDAIKNAFVPGIVKQATVNLTVAEFEPVSVLVSGAVAAPGMVSLRRTERNLLYAVLAANGVSSSASGKVTLHRVRKPDEPVTYDLTDPRQLQDALTISPLQNGDIVMVAAAPPNTIYIGGLVNRPSPQQYPPGVNMNVLQVLASAGGLREDVYPSEGTLIRRMPDGEDVHVKLNLKRIKNGQDENFILAAGDILWVPETPGTKVIDFFNRNLFLRGGATITYNASGTEFLNTNSRAALLRNNNLEDQFNPFGFLDRGATLNQLGAAGRRR